MSREEGGFDFDAIAAHEADKMVRRHPHVFGDVEIPDSEAQTRAWEAHKAAERDDEPRASAGTLEGVARALPALIRAEKLQRRAARVGFDWPAAGEVIAKIREELTEAEREVETAAPRERLAEEIGDLLFAVANLARKLGIDPEAALRAANDKFVRRFRHIEERLAEGGRTPAEATLAEMDALWNEAKGREAGR
jgi:MazG family protein